MKVSFTLLLGAFLSCGSEHFRIRAGENHSQALGHVAAQGAGPITRSSPRRPAWSDTSQTLTWPGFTGGPLGMCCWGGPESCLPHRRLDTDVTLCAWTDCREELPPPTSPFHLPILPVLPWALSFRGVFRPRPHSLSRELRLAHKASGKMPFSGGPSKLRGPCHVPGGTSHFPSLSACHDVQWFACDTATSVCLALDSSSARLPEQGRADLPVASLALGRAWLGAGLSLLYESPACNSSGFPRTRRPSWTRP